MDVLEAVLVSIALVVGVVGVYWIVTNTLFPLVIDLRVKPDGVWLVLLGAIPVYRVPYAAITGVSSISRGELLRMTATRQDRVSLYVMNRLTPLVAIRRTCGRGTIIFSPRNATAFLAAVESQARPAPEPAGPRP